MATGKNILKNWFKTALKPTQAQFWAWMDSYWHKDEKIPTGSIDQLDTILGQKADETSVETRLGNKADKTAVPTKTSQLTNDSGFLTKHQDVSWKADTDAANLSQENVISWKEKLGVGESSGSAFQLLTDQAIIEWDASLGTLAEVTLTADREIAKPTNLSVGIYELVLKQDAVGGHNLFFDDEWKFANGKVPVLSTAPGAVDKVRFVSDGLNIYANYENDYSANSNSLIMAIDTTINGDAANKALSITFSNIPKIKVDWGDGTALEQLEAAGISHIYDAPGAYIVRVIPMNPVTILKIYRSDLTEAPQNRYITDIKQWGNTLLGMAGFVNATHLTTISAKDSPTMYPDQTSTFWGSKVATINNVTNWDVSKVTTTYQMFRATPFNSPIGGWDVSNVAIMNAMFRDADQFNQPLNDWDVGNVTDMNIMFNGAYSFNQPLDKWNVSKVTITFGMFAGRWMSFNQDINSWDVGNVTNMAGMFTNNRVFNKPLGNWDVSKVTDIDGMFMLATAFNQPLTNWNLAACLDLHDMFNTALQFKQPVAQWNINSQASVSNMVGGPDTSYPSANYDALLQKLDENNVKAQSFLADALKYSAAGKVFRDNLIAKGWTFINDSQV